MTRNKYYLHSLNTYRKNTILTTIFQVSPDQLAATMIFFLHTPSSCKTSKFSYPLQQHPIPTMSSLDIPSNSFHLQRCPSFYWITENFTLHMPNHSLTKLTRSSSDNSPRCAHFLPFLQSKWWSWLFQFYLTLAHAQLKLSRKTQNTEAIKTAYCQYNVNFDCKGSKRNGRCIYTW